MSKEIDEAIVEAAKDIQAELNLPAWNVVDIEKYIHGRIDPLLVPDFLLPVRPCYYGGYETYDGVTDADDNTIDAEDLSNFINLVGKNKCTE